jgi:GT2 family glycosyltransferase
MTMVENLTAAEEAPRVTALVLNWRRPEDTIIAVQSLLGSSWPALRVMVLDNGSGDGSAERLKNELPGEVELLVNEKNLGFAGGNNVGIRRALEQEADFIFLLNSDARVTEITVEGLVDALTANPDAGAAGPAILNGSEPPLIESLGGAIDLHSGRIRHHGYGRPWTAAEAEQGPHRTDMINGCAFMVRREAVDETGLMDERFFCYLEEADWCLRLAAAGWPVLLVPGQTVRHTGGTSLGGTSSALRIYFGVRNHLLLLRKNAGHGLPGRWLRSLHVTALWLLFLFVSSGINKVDGLRQLMRGLSDYRQGRFGGAVLEQ